RACCPSAGARPVPGRSAFEPENWAKMLYIGPLSCRCNRGPVALRLSSSRLGQHALTSAATIWIMLQRAMDWAFCFAEDNARGRRGTSQLLILLKNLFSGVE